MERHGQKEEDVINSLLLNTLAPISVQASGADVALEGAGQVEGVQPELRSEALALPPPGAPVGLSMVGCDLLALAWEGAAHASCDAGMPCLRSRVGEATTRVLTMCLCVCVC